MCTIDTYVKSVVVIRIPRSVTIGSYDHM